MRVQVAVAGVHGKEGPPVGKGVIGQVVQRAGQLLLEGRRPLLGGRGRLFGHAALRAQGIAPLAVVRRARTLVLCKMKTRGFMKEDIAVTRDTDGVAASGDHDFTGGGAKAP